MTLEELKEQMGYAAQCGGGINHGDTCGSAWEFTFDDIAEIIKGQTHSPEGYGSSSTDALVKLKNGKYGTFWEWADTTGHGCQCGSKAEVWNTEEEAIRMGLTDSGREALGYPKVA